MKRFLLIGLITMAAAGCRKDNANKSKSLTGTWKFVTAIGGIAGNRINASADFVRLLKLNSDSTYTTLINNRLISQGTYSITNQTSGGTTNTVITYDASPHFQFISVKNDSLFTSDPFPDGYGTVYVRQ